MPAPRRLPLAAACAVVGAACAATPAFTWLSATGHPGHCGWTCYVPTTQAPQIATLTGRGGTQVAAALAVLLVVVAVLALLAALTALRPAGPPPLLGWAIVAAGFAALVWTVLVIVRYAEGGTLVRTPRDGVFSANPSVGAVAALVATAAAVLLGGLLALRTDGTILGGAPADAEAATGSAGRGPGDATDDRSPAADRPRLGARYADRSRS